MTGRSILEAADQCSEETLGKGEVNPRDTVRPAESRAKQARTELPLSLRAARFGLKALEAVSPRTAARALSWLMFRTQRSTPPERERETLAGGARWELAGPRGRLVAHRFGQGPAVVLVHGWNGRGAQLGSFVAPLVLAGYQVVSFDAPGHGESEGSEASLVWFADAFDRVVQSLRESGVTIHGVVAHSLGAAAVTFSEARRLRAAAATSFVVESLLGRLVFVAPPIDVRDWIDEFTAVFGVSARTEHIVRGLVQARVGYRFADMYAPDLAREMRAPLLVLHDEHDRAVPSESGRLLAEAWPRATLVASSGLGHMRILRDQSSVQRAVAFIREEAVEPSSSVRRAG
ncbi:MAG: alpha/beta hydrolase [Myxococcota bacterium]